MKYRGRSKFEFLDTRSNVTRVGGKNVIYSRTGTRDRHCTSIINKNYPGAPRIVRTLNIHR